jgi:peptidoglycan/LPS O-acetylase OafA/YrhL
MDNAKNLRKIKLLVRIVGALLALFGVISLVSTFANWSTANTLTLACSLPIYFLMLVGGSLLLAFRQDGLEIVFVILRLYILLGIGTVASGVVIKQPGTIIFGCSVLVIVVGLMVFLSQTNVKSLFEKKAS